MLAWPAAALACACCANKGDYLDVTEPVKQFEVNELLRLKYGTAANLRTTPAFPADVKGLKFVSEKYTLSRFTHGRIVVFTLKDAKGHSGTISFVIPPKATKHHADIQDGKTAPGGGPLLYREWTLRGTLSGSLLKRAASFRLVLQGRGNACMNARDFRSWILVASGPQVSFTLFGKFTPVPA